MRKLLELGDESFVLVCAALEVRIVVLKALAERAEASEHPDVARDLLYKAERLEIILKTLRDETPWVD